jgi:hypothetical protein
MSKPGNESRGLELGAVTPIAAEKINFGANVSGNVRCR